MLTKRYGSAHRPIAPADDSELPPMFRAQAYRDTHLPGTIKGPAAYGADPNVRLLNRNVPGVDPAVTRGFVEAPGEWAVRAP